MNAKSHADLDAEKARLLQRDTEWALADSEGRDVERIVSYWTDDAIVLPPGLAAVVGKTALRQYVHDSMQIPGFKITWTSSDVIFSPDQNLADLFSDKDVTLEALVGEPATTPWQGHHV